MEYTRALLVASTVCLASLSLAQWQKHYPTAANQPNYRMIAMKVDSAGNSYMTGTIDSQFTETSTVKFGPAGNFLWEQKLTSNTASEIPGYLVLDNLNNVLVLGTSSVSTYVSSVSLVKYNTVGGLIKSTAYALGGPARPCGIGTDSTGLAYWAGTGVKAGLSNVFVFGLKADGTTNWEKYYDLSGKGDVANAFTVDKLGNSYVCGTYTTSTGTSIEVIKHDKNGTLLWHYVYPEPTGGRDVPAAIATDAASNVYIAGSQKLSSQANPDILTLKVNANGTFAWKQVYDGASHSADNGRAIALDTNGDVYVAGSTYVNNTGYRAVLLRYSNPGVLLGSTIPAFPGAGYVVPHYLQVDSVHRIYMLADGYAAPSDPGSSLFGAYFDSTLHAPFLNDFGLGSARAAGIFSDSVGNFYIGCGVNYNGPTSVFYMQQLNQYPIAVPDHYYANYGSMLSEDAAHGVKANDIYVKNQTVVGQGGNLGQLNLQGSGAFTWFNGATFFGTDQFYYYEAGVAGSSFAAKCTITVVPALIGLSVNTASVVGGTAATGKITLNHSVTSPTVVATLSSNNPAVASVPTTVTATLGANSATFPITTHPVATAQTVTITARWNGLIRTVQLKVNP